MSTLPRTYRKTLDGYIDQALYNGTFQPGFFRTLGLSRTGCPYRGTTVCTQCPLSPPALCEWRCQVNKVDQTVTNCPHRSACPCSMDQSRRLRKWGLIE